MGDINQIVSEFSLVDMSPSVFEIDIVILYGNIVYAEPKYVALADFSILHIQLDNAEAAAKIGVLFVNINVVDGLVASHRLAV